jgi:hypothetical protein
MLLKSKVLSAVILFALTGCAFDLAHVSYKFASLSLLHGQQKSIVLQNLTEVPTPCFHTRILQGGTHWVFIGTKINRDRHHFLYFDTWSDL